MIFLTVGHQTPFDRLVKAVDDSEAGQNTLSIFAQIGEGSYEPKAFPYERWLSAERFEEVLSQSSAVISHAGTGTILQVLAMNKPLLVLPRRAEKNETRNDHQIGTARYFSQNDFVISINHESEISLGFDKLLDWKSEAKLKTVASPELIGRISDFINDR